MHGERMPANCNVFAIIVNEFRPGDSSNAMLIHCPAQGKPLSYSFMSRSYVTLLCVALRHHTAFRKRPKLQLRTTTG